MPTARRPEFYAGVFGDPMQQPQYSQWFAIPDLTTALTTMQWTSVSFDANVLVPTGGILPIVEVQFLAKATSQAGSFQIRIPAWGAQVSPTISMPANGQKNYRCYVQPANGFWVFNAISQLVTTFAVELGAQAGSGGNAIIQQAQCRLIWVPLR